MLAPCRSRWAGQRGGRTCAIPTKCWLAALQALLQQEADEHHQSLLETPFYEVTIASVDQQKLLSRLSEALVRVLAAME